MDGVEPSSGSYKEPALTTELHAEATLFELSAIAREGVEPSFPPYQSGVLKPLNDQALSETLNLLP